MRLLPVLAFAAALTLAAPVRAEVPRVVATIKPIHSLVAAVMGDLGSPALIVKGGASPHTYSLRPSDAEALQAADVVFWTGYGFEKFLQAALETLAVKARVVELAASKGLELLSVREGGVFEPDADEEEAPGPVAEAAREAADMHFWLDPINATRLTIVIADALGRADPENAGTYAANARAYNGELLALTAALEASLAPLRDKPFIVFHDSYQYLERRFGLAVAGSITVTPDTMPGVRRVGELRDKIEQSGAGCVFAEPQFRPAIVSAIIEGTGARAGELDPEGANLEEGSGLYRQLLENLAASLVDCLAK